MKLLDAIYNLLTIHSQPMHVKELTQALLDQGLWHTAGKTPKDTVSAYLYSDVKKNGKKSRFIKVGPGAVFGLSSVIVSNVPCPNAAPVGVVSGSKKMTFLAAAEHILKAQGKKAAMHYETITDIALAQNLLSTRGKTPAATMIAQISDEVRRARKRGDLPRFVLCGKGMISLTAWQKTGVNLQIAQHRSDISKQIRARLQKMSPERFEQFAADFLSGLGLENVATTRLVGDKGVDARGTMLFAGVIRMKMAVQVKRWKGSVGAPIVRDMRGSVTADERGMIITLGDFASGAKAEAEAPGKFPIALLNGDKLVDLMLENRIGVNAEEATLFEIDDEFFA